MMNTIGKIRPTISDDAETLNVAIDEIEKLLKSLFANVAEVPLEDGKRLALHKFEGRRGIFIIDSDDKHTHWKSAGLGLRERVQLCLQLPALRAALGEADLQLVAAVDRAMEVTTDLLAELRDLRNGTGVEE